MLGDVGGARSNAAPIPIVAQEVLNWRMKISLLQITNQKSKIVNFLSLVCHWLRPLVSTQVCCRMSASTEA